MMADELDDDASETGSLLGVKKRSRVKNSWLDDEAGEDIGEVGEQVNEDDVDDDENTTGIDMNHIFSCSRLSRTPSALIRERH